MHLNGRPDVDIELGTISKKNEAALVEHTKERIAQELKRKIPIQVYEEHALPRFPRSNRPELKICFL